MKNLATFDLNNIKTNNTTCYENICILVIVGSIATIIACSFLLLGILKVSNNYRLYLEDFTKKRKISSLLILKQHVSYFITQERQRYLILWLGITSFTLCGCLLIFIIRISSQTTNTFKVIVVHMTAHTFQIYHKVLYL